MDKKQFTIAENEYNTNETIFNGIKIDYDHGYFTATIGEEKIKFSTFTHMIKHCLKRGISY